MAELIQQDIGLCTKIKAIYGKRLRYEDYINLKHMRSVAEITAYLQKHSGYKDVLKGITEDSMHRGIIEMMLKNELTEEYARIMNFVKGNDQKLLYCMIIHFEILEIMHFLRTLISSNEEEYYPRITKEIAKRSTIPFEELKKVKSFSAFVEALKDTRYYNILKHFLKDTTIDYAKIEVALKSDYFKYIVRTVDKYLSGQDKLIMKTFVGGQIDITNFTRIIRCKRYFFTDKNAIYSELLPLTYKIDRRKINAMVEAPSWQEAYKMVDTTAYKKLFSKFHFDMVEQYYYEFIWEMAHKIMHSNQISVCVPYAYLNVKQLEIKNVTNVIEGIRYQVEPETIDKYLIGVGA